MVGTEPLYNDDVTFQLYSPNQLTCHIERVCSLYANLIAYCDSAHQKPYAPDDHVLCSSNIFAQ